MTKLDINTLIQFWLPIGAFLISIASILISLSNSIFNRRFESAKKRTELLSELLKGKPLLEAKREELFKVKTICGECSKSRGTEICNSYDQIIKNIEITCNIIEKLKNHPSPIKIEKILSKQIVTNHNITDLVNEIDTFIIKCKKCEQHNSKDIQ